MNTTALIATYARCEIARLVRTRATAIALVASPAFLFALSLSSGRVPDIDGTPGPVYLLATYGTFVLFGVTLFGVGLGFAVERSRGHWDAVRRSPIPVSAAIAAKLATCLAFTSGAFLVLLAVAVLGFGVDVPWTRLPVLALAMTLSSVPLCALGLLLGALLSADAAPIVFVVVYLVLSSISGIVVPMEMLARSGPLVPSMAPLWPTYHAGELALAALRSDSLLLAADHALALVAVAVGLSALAYLAARRAAPRP